MQLNICVSICLSVRLFICRMKDYRTYEETKKKIYCRKFYAKEKNIILKLILIELRGPMCKKNLPSKNVDTSDFQKKN